MAGGLTGALGVLAALHAAEARKQEQEPVLIRLPLGEARLVPVQQRKRRVAIRRRVNIILMGHLLPVVLVVLLRVLPKCAMK